jgi:hypothetical protein
MEQRITDYVTYAAAEPTEGWEAAPASAEPAAILPVRFFSAVAPVALAPSAPMFDPGRSERRSAGRRH